ncbi:MAG: hypothetical protein IKO93_16570, partial [Lentisphaeria bacterium]|nr:hypothetical protein [Lentisphaeria bacterium]
TVIRSVMENPAWSGFMIWMFCNANTYTDTAYRTGRPRSYNNKGLVDEYRRATTAWRMLPEIIRPYLAGSCQ